MPRTCIVFGGGAQKGFAYLGVIERLRETGVLPRISTAVGASVGALAAMGVAADLQDLLPSVLEFERFQRQFRIEAGPSGLLSTHGLVHLASQALTKRFRNTITFQQMHDVTGTRLVVTVTNTRGGMVEHMDHTTAPDVRVVDAVAASMAVPFLFAPHRIGGRQYMDGGIRCNVPAHVCDAKDSIVCFFESKLNSGLSDPGIVVAFISALCNYEPDERAVNIALACDGANSVNLANVLLSSSDVPQMIVRLVRHGYVQTANALDCINDVS